MFGITKRCGSLCHHSEVDRLANRSPSLAKGTTDTIHSVYQKLDSALSSLNYKELSSLLTRDHETIHPDERRVTRQDWDNAALPFEGLRECPRVHTVLRVNPAPQGCTVVAESTAVITEGARSFQEDLLMQDLWKVEDDQWRLRRRIIMRQRRKAPGYFSLMEHPLYCQFGQCRTEKTTWQEGSRSRRRKPYAQIP